MPARTSPTNASDHDLLIEIKTRLDVLQSSVRDNHTAISLRLDQKADYKDLDVLRAAITQASAEAEKRAQAQEQKDAKQDEEIGFAKKMIYIAIGAIGVLEPVILYWLNHSK